MPCYDGSPSDAFVPYSKGCVDRSYKVNKAGYGAFYEVITTVNEVTPAVAADLVSADNEYLMALKAGDITKVKVNVEGRYRMAVSVQFVTGTDGQYIIEAYPRVNGVDIPNANVRAGDNIQWLTAGIEHDAPLTNTCEFYAKLKKDDTIELIYELPTAPTGTATWVGRLFVSPA